MGPCAFEIDHIKPHKLRGGNGLNNAQILQMLANRSKGGDEISGDDLKKLAWKVDWQRAYNGILPQILPPGQLHGLQVIKTLTHFLRTPAQDSETSPAQDFINSDGITMNKLPVEGDKSFPVDVLRI
uniref:Uncharacterized protein n=1 Tax=Leersia perrieri TaxID=77586 RepID=A0A0D9WIZ6_9ORYZ